MPGWIFFDLDGTLIDHDGAANQAAILTLQNDLSQSADQLARWNSVSEAWFQKHLAGMVSYEEQRRARLREFEPSLSDTECDRIFANYLTVYEGSCRTFPEVYAELKELGATFKLGIISNGNGAQQRRKLDHAGLSGLIELVLVSDEVGFSKPDSRIFLYALKQAGEPSIPTPYIGDRLDIDAKASTNAGMQGIWLNRNSAISDLETTTIHSLTGLGKTISCIVDSKK